MSKRRAFTLVELLIIMAVLAILAAIAIPRYTSATDTSRTAAMSTNVRLIRGYIAMHAAQSTIELSDEGFPAEVHAEWFPRDTLPDHAWTGQPMIIEVVNAATNVIYPASKVYDTSNPASANAWYNNSNGAFCVRVPPQATDAETLAMFNSANSCTAIGINQTTAN